MREAFGSTKIRVNHRARETDQAPKCKAAFPCKKRALRATAEVAAAQAPARAPARALGISWAEAVKELHSRRTPQASGSARVRRKSPARDNRGDEARAEIRFRHREFTVKAAQARPAESEAVRARAVDRAQAVVAAVPAAARALAAVARNRAG